LRSAGHEPDSPSDLRCNASARFKGCMFEELGVILAMSARLQILK
jgi:hypothetical protein